MRRGRSPWMSRSPRWLKRSCASASLRGWPAPSGGKIPSAVEPGHAAVPRSHRSWEALLQPLRSAGSRRKPRRRCSWPGDDDRRQRASSPAVSRRVPTLPWTGRDQVLQSLALSGVKRLAIRGGRAASALHLLQSHSRSHRPLQSPSTVRFHLLRKASNHPVSWVLIAMTSPTSWETIESRMRHHPLNEYESIQALTGLDAGSGSHPPHLLRAGLSLRRTA